MRSKLTIIKMLNIWKKISLERKASFLKKIVFYEKKKTFNFFPIYINSNFKYNIYIYTHKYI